MKSSNELLEALHDFDGKHTDSLLRVAGLYGDEPRFFERLLLMSDWRNPERIRVGATWLLLHQMKNGATAAGYEKSLARMLAEESDWEARLHLLQILDMIDLRKTVKPDTLQSLLKTATELAEDDKTLVRAWALGLLARLGGCLPRARAAIRKRIEHAESTDAASVKARVRRVRSAGGLDWMES